MTLDILTSYRRRFIYIYSFVGFADLLVFGVLPHWNYGSKALALFELLIALSLVANILFYRKHRNFGVLSNIALFLMMFMFSTLVITGGYKGTGIFWSFGYPLLSFFLNSKKEALFWNMLFPISLALLYYMEPSLFYYDFVTLRQALGVYITIFILAFAYNSVVSDLIGVFSEKASFDSLTGLYSRSFFLETLDRTLAHLDRHGGGTHTLIYIDLDNFKYVNDKFGHHMGDEVLKEVAYLIKSSFRRGDVVARFGGDEFMILSFNSDKEGIERKLKDIMSRVEERFALYGISMSWGVVQVPDDGKLTSELVKEADRRMYSMKLSKRL